MADLDFQGKHAGEEIIFYYHRHWVKLLWPFIKTLLVNVVIFSIGYMMFFAVPIEEPITRRVILGTLTFFFITSHLELVSRIYKYLLYIVVVTDKKIHRINKTLIAIDDHQSMDLWMMQDIKKSQDNIFQNIFGYGTLIFEAQETVLKLHLTPHINERYTKIMHLREQARQHMVRPGNAATLFAPKGAETPNTSSTIPATA